MSEPRPDAADVSVAGQTLPFPDFVSVPSWHFTSPGRVAPHRAFAEQNPTGGMWRDGHFTEIILVDIRGLAGHLRRIGHGRARLGTRVLGEDQFIHALLRRGERGVPELRCGWLGYRRVEC